MPGLPDLRKERLWPTERRFPDDWNWGTGDDPGRAYGRSYQSELPAHLEPAALDAPLFDPKLRTNTWCHGGEHLWSIMGAHLSGGVALKWLKNNILGAESLMQ